MGPVGVVLDERSQERHHRRGLLLTRRTQIDVLVVETAELGERLGDVG